MKTQLDYLVLETTRRCNMKCAHCLRGPAQNKDMPYEVIDNALKDVSYIGCITFGGGEPTLNVEAIEYTLRVCIERGINVMNFYVVTNGKQVTKRFIYAMMSWYFYTTECGGDPEYSGVAMSQDMFHEKVPSKNVIRLSSLSFFKDTEKRTDWNKIPVINEGNALFLSDVPKREKVRSDYVTADWINDELVLNDTILYVTVDGDVFLDCDLSYESQANIIEEESSLYVGNVKETFSNILLKYAPEKDLEETA